MIRLIIPCASLPTSPPHPLILGNSRAATKSKPHQIWTEPTLFPIWRPSRNESSQKSKSIASQEELNDWQQISIRHRLQHWDFASKKNEWLKNSSIRDSSSMDSPRWEQALASTSSKRSRTNVVSVHLASLTEYLAFSMPITQRGPVQHCCSIPHRGLTQHLLVRHMGTTGVKKDSPSLTNQKFVLVEGLRP